MKNEEKALKLAGLKETPDEEERYYNPFNCNIYDKCLEMAEWKEEKMMNKFKSFLENTDWFKKNCSSITSGVGVVRLNIESILEDFKNYMEL